MPIKHIDIERDEPGDPQIITIADNHPHPKLYNGKRLWNVITGVTLHQTGCQMPTNPQGWSRLNAHIGITREGKVVIVNDPTDMIWHAQGLSRSTIGVEIAGNFCGIDGDEKTLWVGGGGPDKLNDAMILALDRTFDWLVKEFHANGALWKHVFAHRQSAKSRIGDPGSEIWQKVAMPWMKKAGAAFGIYVTEGGPLFQLGRGRPIPKEWDSSCPKRYYEK